MERGEAIEHPWVTRAIENAQRKVEGRNFDMRKQLLEYDDVANDQRKVIYEQRNELLDEGEISGTIEVIRKDVVNGILDQYIPPQSLEEMWDVAGLEERFKAEFLTDMPVQKWLDEDDKLYEEKLRERVLEEVDTAYKSKEEIVGPEVIRQFEKAVMLQNLDSHWKEHLAAMDHLRQGIHLRGYAQKNPKQEYKRESFELFTEMLEALKVEVVTILSKVQVKAQEDVAAVEEQRRQAGDLPKNFEHRAASEPEQKPEHKKEQENAAPRQGPKVGRNDACPCGSGKKYKQCHGKLS
jgi:preprotein translocase subunit SecA